MLPKTFSPSPVSHLAINVMVASSFSCRSEPMWHCLKYLSHNRDMQVKVKLLGHLWNCCKANFKLQRDFMVNEVKVSCNFSSPTNENWFGKKPLQNCLSLPWRDWAKLDKVNGLITISTHLSGQLLHEQHNCNLWKVRIVCQKNK